MSTLTEQADLYAAEKAAPGSVADLAVRRAFMAGALAALTTKAPYQTMLAECVQYGRTIGTKVEAA